MIEPIYDILEVSYRDYSKEIHLLNYADIVVVDDKTNNLIMMRFGGYSEAVKAMADAIGAGGSIDVNYNGYWNRYYCKAKEYVKDLKKERYYAECIIRRKDVEDKAKAEDDDEDESASAGPEEVKRAYIYLKKDSDRKKLFREIDKKTSIPMLPEFGDYVIKRMEEECLLYELTVYTKQEEMTAWCMIRDDEEIGKIVEEGIKAGHIKIPGSEAKHKGAFENINGVTEYLKNFATQIAEKIKVSFKPLFDPATDTVSPYIEEIEKKLKQKGITLYAGQKAVIESINRKMKESKSNYVVSECGSGKSKMCAASIYINAKEKGKGKAFCGILCPGMIKEKWVREIEETLPNSKGYIIHDIAELKKAYESYQSGNNFVFTIISKETARDGYMKKPAVKWNKVKKGFVCPDCGKIIEMELSDDGDKYLVTADQAYFRKETSDNHKCRECGTVLWTAINPEDRKRRHNDWVKISEYGFLYRDKIQECILGNLDDENPNEALIERLEEIAMFPEIYLPIKAAYRKYGLSTYIKKKMKRAYDYFILDELQQYKGDTGQGYAMAEIVKASRKIIGATGTLINGYSQGIFYLLYRCFPRFLRQDNKEYNNSRAFNHEYGVIEETYELKNSTYNTASRAKRTKKRERQLPGVSPLVFTRFLLENAVFLSLNDMTSDMPEYEEIPIILSMEKEVEQEYDRIESTLKGILQSERKISRRILSKYLDILSIYPDQPYGHKPIVSPEDGSILVEPEDKGDSNSIWEKDEKVLELVEQKINNGEKVLIYTNWVKTDTQDKLKRLLTAKGYRVAILRAETVNIEKRERWVENAVNKDGIQILITNPSLVETGLDLNSFTTIIFYNIGYNLFNLRQSSRRSWRINQTFPRIEVYFLCYRGTMQERALRLMASKLAVATTIEGQISDEGLSAMSDISDLTTALARELSLGIQSEVEDISAIYKKMAILKPKTEAAEPNNINITRVLPENEENMHNPGNKIFNNIEQKDLDYMLKLLEPVETTARKKKKVNENQITLFDILLNKSA